VEASKEGASLYAKCGFVSREQMVLEGGIEREMWKAYGRIGYTLLERGATLN
jgi:hypothetical protein